jgi:uncharacterized protein (DUF4415 family)
MKQKPTRRELGRVREDRTDWQRVFRAQGRGYQTRLNAVLRPFYEEARSRQR